MTRAELIGANEQADSAPDIAHLSDHEHFDLMRQGGKPLTLVSGSWYHDDDYYPDDIDYLDVVFPLQSDRLYYCPDALDAAEELREYIEALAREQFTTDPEERAEHQRYVGRCFGYSEREIEAFVLRAAERDQA